MSQKVKLAEAQLAYDRTLSQIKRRMQRGDPDHEFLEHLGQKLHKLEDKIAGLKRWVAAEESQRRQDEFHREATRWTAERYIELVAQHKGPNRLRTWSSKKGGPLSVRIYFPRDAGYLTVFGYTVSPISRGYETLHRNLLYPPWRKAIDRAKVQLDAETQDHMNALWGLE